MIILATNPVWAVADSARNELSAALQRVMAITDVQMAERSIPLPVRMVGKTAVVSISGPMINGPSWLSLYGFAVTGDIRAAVANAAADRAVTDIVLRINSPGGSVSGVSGLSDAVAEAARIKPVRTGVDGMMASAALQVGVQARSVSAGRGDMIGSIGTYAVLYDTSEAYEQAGIKPILVSSGGLKGQGVDGLPITEELIADTQRIVDAYTNEFKASVATGRRLSGEQVSAVATGQVWLAADAQRLGLIDSVESFDRAMQVAQQRTAQMQRNQARLRLAEIS